MHQILKKAYYAVLDFLFPSLCRICEGPLDGAKWVCSGCFDRIIEILPPYCHICGLPLPHSFMETERPVCKDCKQEIRHFKAARSVAVYDGVMRECIHLLKYEGKTALSKPLGMRLSNLVERDSIEVDLLVPVPLHPKKRRERGFNQAELLSSKIASQLGIPINRKDLVKRKPTPSQTELDRRERITNVKGSFAIRKRDPFFNKRVLLVDDVFTTGATVNECSRVLLEAGAKAVYVVTLGRKV
jgi:ComF family protein